MLFAGHPRLAMMEFGNACTPVVVKKNVFICLIVNYDR